MRISQSGLKRFNECPGKCYLRYGEGREEETNHFAEVGKIVHDLIKADQGGDPVIEPAKLSGVWVEALDQFDRWKRIFKPELDPEDVLSVEEHSFIKLGNHELEFRFDDLRLIGGFIYLTDYKTTFKFMTVEEMRKDIQTRVYCVVAAKLFPQYDDFIYRIANTRHGQYQTLELTRDEIEEWEKPLIDFINMVAANIEARKKGDKTACQFTPGQACLMCGFTKFCPAFKTMLAKAPTTKAKAPPILKNARSAKTAAIALTVISKFSKALREKLKAYCEANGPVEAGDLRWAIRTEQTSVIDIERVPEELRPQLDPYMKLNDGKSSKIWEDLNLLKKLQEFGAIKVKSSSEFGPKSLKQEDEE